MSPVICTRQSRVVALVTSNQASSGSKLLCSLWTKLNYWTKWTAEITSRSAQQQEATNYSSNKCHQLSTRMGTVHLIVGPRQTIAQTAPGIRARQRAGATTIRDNASLIFGPRRSTSLAHSTYGGHLAFKCTRDRIRLSFYWPTLSADVKLYCYVRSTSMHLLFEKWAWFRPFRGNNFCSLDLDPKQPWVGNERP